MASKGASLPMNPEVMAHGTSLPALSPSPPSAFTPSHISSLPNYLKNIRLRQKPQDDQKLRYGNKISKQTGKKLQADAF